MNAEIRHASIDVDCSLMNLFDISMLYTLAWPAHAFVDAAQRAGYRGLEWHPVRGITSMQLKRGLISDPVREGIISFHQSWRSEKNIGEVLKHPNRFIAVSSFLLLPEKTNSLHELVQISEMIGKDLPIILYPTAETEQFMSNLGFQERLFQPTPEIMQAWHVNTGDELIREAEKHGYTGFCVDLFHIRGEEIGGKSLEPWQETLPVLLNYTDEIHIAARTDMKRGNVKSEEELQDLLCGKGNSELMQMLSLVHAEKWSGRIVTEIPVHVLHALHGSSELSSLLDDHARIIETIQTTLA